MHIQNLIKELHRKNVPGLFLKLDISKAFDSVNRAYLLEVLQHLGFGQRWRDWICMTLASASWRILLNGNPSKPFCHAHGLWQGDPLSPMLFILAIDPLQQILILASQRGILKPVRTRTTTCKVSLLADDACIFANLDKEELHALYTILATFGEASRLITNLSKTEVFPIRCEGINLAEILTSFPAKLAPFPGQYLSLSLHFRRLRRIDFQPLIDKLVGRMPGWKGKHLNKTGKGVSCKISAHGHGDFPSDGPCPAQVALMQDQQDHPWFCLAEI